ncbi:hypothetical protein RRF57_007527 [Xylaria bambusicola]|uniref:Uncharacterized protein n=1 Tax=Xylaria bambusicola TaxID=326684 RepID=A0AAN7UL99_9PEZI
MQLSQIPPTLTDMLSSKLVEPSIILLRSRNVSSIFHTPTNETAHTTILLPKVDDIAEHPI